MILDKDAILMGWVENYFFIVIEVKPFFREKPLPISRKLSPPKADSKADRFTQRCPC